MKESTVAIRMHQYFGESKPNVCQDCRFLKKERHGRFHYICEISNATHGVVFGFVSWWDACGKFERVPPKVTEEIDRAIADADGSVRDALNIALTKIKILEREIEILKEVTE